MKRRDLVRKLEELGYVLVRHGGSHDWYTNPSAKKSQPVPRHSEIHE
ncbi:MAG: type II toxin-antitoxin system HicA family toxin [Terriglobia bacterium]